MNGFGSGFGEESACPRCRLPAGSPHPTPDACIAALGSALAAMRAELDALNADLADRRAQEQRQREQRADVDALLARGG